MATKVQRSKAPTAILQLHIELRGTKPKVWRRVLVPETITLLRLHLVIQASLRLGPLAPARVHRRRFARLRDFLASHADEMALWQRNGAKDAAEQAS